MLALDLGFSLGFAILQADGQWFSGKLPLAQRESDHPGARYRRFREWLGVQTELIPKPLVIAHEELNTYGHFVGVLSLAGMRGILLAFCAEHNFDVVEVPIRVLKKFATGNGNADKEAMKKAASDHFHFYNPERDPNGDEADALMVAYWIESGSPVWGRSKRA